MTTTAVKKTSRARSALVGILFALACLGIVVGTVAVWAHQTLLKTDRFVAVVDRIAADPSVQSTAAERIARQVVAGADVQGRIAGVLPPAQAFLAVPLASAVENVLDQRLEQLLGTPRAQDAIVGATRLAHEKTVAVLRGDTRYLDTTGPEVTIDLLPLAVDGFAQLQAMGIVPADIQLPTAIDAADRPATIAALETRLGRDVPDDLGIIPVADASAIQSAQTIVHWFDVAVVAIVVVTLVLLVLTVLLSRSRLRMVALLALGAVVALALARVVIRTSVDAVITSLSGGGPAPIARVSVQSLTTDLATWTWLLIIVGIVVAILAVLLGRPRWLSTDDGAATWLQVHADDLVWALGIVGGAAIAWVAAGADVAILVAIGLLAVALIVRGRRTPSDAGAATSPDPAPGSTLTPPVPPT